MLLEELHDEGAALVQRAAQRGVGHLLVLQLPQHVLRLRACGHGVTLRCRGTPRGAGGAPKGAGELRGGSPGRSKVKMSPSHLALLGVLGSELQLERRRSLRLGDVGSSVDESRSGGGKKLQSTLPLTPN